MVRVGVMVQVRVMVKVRVRVKIPRGSARIRADSAEVCRTFAGRSAEFAEKYFWGKFAGSAWNRADSARIRVNSPRKFFRRANRVRNYRGRVSNFNQSEARKHCFLVSDWSKFETLPR